MSDGIPFLRMRETRKQDGISDREYGPVERN